MICKTIRQFRISSKYKGYPIIVDAIEMYIVNNGKTVQITKDIYPILAQKYNMSLSSVERDIRTIVEVCWQNDKCSVEEILGYKTNKCPSNSIFLDAISYHILNTCK